MKKIIVGSRRSKLALTQTNWVIDQLKKIDPTVEFELKEIVTKGDRILDVQLSKVGGKGLFVKEIEQAMLDKEIDIAIHSMKDMPAILPKGLMIGCVPPREDYRDALISKGNVKFEDLKPNAVIGTSSLRRSAQLLAARPDLEIKWIRGNIDTRIEKLNNEDYDAIILATAGLRRMGWADDVITQHLSEELCLPAIGQGALAIECRIEDTFVRKLLNKFNCENTNKVVTAERAFLTAMDGGCQVPIAGLGKMLEDGQVSLKGLVASPDGKIVYSETIIGQDPEKVGKEVANVLTKMGAKALIEQVKEEQ